ncbi:MAG: hypothetical protein KDA52_11385 [Planctomycetaceae bacterium]|nr:hypothetical protein [Planctomycetaceae bacterium]
MTLDSSRLGTTFGPSQIKGEPLVLVYRLMFAVISVTFCINTFRAGVVLCDPITVPWKLALCVWFLSGALFLIQWPHWLVRVLHYVTVSWVLTHSMGVFNVECKFFVTMSFFNIWFNFRKGQINSERNAHLLHAMLLSFGAYLFFGGFITKMQDNYWRAGDGIHYVMSLPWIGPKWARELFTHTAFTGMANWGALIAESAILPFAIFRWSRPAAVLAFVSFALFLCFGLRIQLIGWEALAVAVLFLSTIVPFKSPIPTERRRIANWDILGPVVSYTLVAILTAHAARVALGYGFSPALYLVGRSTLNIQYDKLFTKEHFLSIDAFRVLLIGSDGQVREPIQVFLEDGTAGPQSSGILSSRWLQAEMYRMDRHFVAQYIGASGSIPPSVGRVVQYCLAANNETVPIERVEVLVREVSLPNPESDWMTLMTFDLSEGKFDFHEEIVK